MKRAWRWLKRGVLGTLVLAVVAVIAVVIALHTDWGRNLVRARIEATLREVLPGGATVGAFEGSVFGTLRVRQLVINGNDAKPMITVGTIEAELELLPLLRGTARMSRVEVSDVVVDLHPQPPPRPMPVQPPSPWTIELPWIHVAGARIVATTPDGPLTLEGVSVVAAARLARRDGPLSAIAHVAGRWKERNVPVSVFGTAALVGQEVRVPFAAVTAERAHVIAAAVDVTARSGLVVVDGPAATIARLVPGASVPGDVVARITATPHAGETQVVLSAAVGAARGQGAFLANLDARTVRGVLGATDVELGPLTHDQVRGQGAAIVAIVAVVTDGVTARGTLIARAAVDEAPHGAAVLGFEASRTAGIDRATGFAIVHADGDARLAVVGAATRTGAAIVVERAVVGARVADPVAASAGRAPVRGALSADLVAAGPLDALDVTGTLRGTGVRYEKVSIARARVELAGRVQATPTGTAHIEINGMARAGVPLGAATIDVRMRADHTVAVQLRARPAAARLVVDASATVRLPAQAGGPIDIALGPHRVQTATRAWAGRGGSVRVDATTIRVRDVRSSNGAGTVGVSAAIGRGAPTVTAAVTVEEVSLAGLPLGPELRGTLDGRIAIERKGARWTGGGTITAHDLVVAPGARPLTVAATLGLAGRRVTVSGKASNPELGGAHVALEVEGPRDLLDVTAWLRVPRKDLHAITLGFDSLQPRALTDGRVPGVYDGTIEIRDGVPDGKVRVRGVPTPLGAAGADLSIALTEVGFVDVEGTATIGSLGDAVVTSRLQIPDRPFDPAEWRRLGIQVVRGATVSAKDIAIEPRVLALVGVELPLRGVASAEVTVGAGGSSVSITADVRDVRGGPIVLPLAAHVEIGADARGTRGALRVTRGERVLLEVRDASTPITLARWQAAAATALTAQVLGTLVIPSTEAKELLAIVGRTDVIGGTASGTITLGGTVGTPTGAGTIDLRAIVIAPRLARRPPPVLDALHVEGSWGGASGRIKITGQESSKGTLAIEASGRPDRLASVLGSIKIHDFDLAPVVAFLPDRLRGASGKLDADLSIRGLDPATGRVRGSVKLVDGRVPLAPIIGTLRRANATLTIDDRGVTAKLDGRIGAGAVSATATAGLDGMTTDITAKLTKVSPIGGLQPVIDAQVRGTLRRSGFKITGDLVIDKTTVVIPERGGTPLLDAAAPPDLVFVDLPVPRLAVGARAPEHPWLVVNVTLAPSRVEVPEFAVIADVRGKLAVAVGETVGLDGEVRVTRGNADVFGHRYRVEYGQVAFDGTTDALVDLKLAHDFPEVTTFVRFAGRVSQLATVEPEFTSEPGLYSRGQLLGFFLGGEPGGDPNRQTREAVTGFGASLASSTLGKRIKRLLPIKLDVLRCIPSSTSNGASCTFGRWWSREVFVSYTVQDEARYDESTGNGKVEWHFKPDWTLETGLDLSYVGADLSWRHRW